MNKKNFMVLFLIFIFGLLIVYNIKPHKRGGEDLEFSQLEKMGIRLQGLLDNYNSENKMKILEIAKEDPITYAKLCSGLLQIMPLDQVAFRNEIISTLIESAKFVKESLSPNQQQEFFHIVEQISEQELVTPELIRSEAVKSE